MAIEFKCTNCQKPQSVPDYSAGKMFKCGCGRALIVPGGESQVSGWTYAMVAVIIATAPILFYLLVFEESQPGEKETAETAREEPEAAVEPAAKPSTDNHGGDSTSSGDATVPEEQRVHRALPFSVLMDIESVAHGKVGTVKPAARIKAGKGDRLFRMGRYEDALLAYQEALAQNPGDRATRRRLAAALFETKSYDDAVEEAKALVEGDGEDAAAHFLLGCIWARLEDDVEARRQLRMTVELAPAFRDAREELKTVLQTTGKEE